jgi:hypothetical protein
MIPSRASSLVSAELILLPTIDISRIFSGESDELSINHPSTKALNMSHRKVRILGQIRSSSALPLEESHIALLENNVSQQLQYINSSKTLLEGMILTERF